MRMPRVNIENALYYVTSRGDNNENIFSASSDYNTYIDLLKKAKVQFGFKLFSYLLMPNHLHLLIELKEGSSISQIMHNLNSNYTKYFNREHNKKGHLFQERFKLVLAEKEPYLLSLTAYIHLNPKSLNLVIEAGDYEYSSLPSYLYNKVGVGKIDIANEISETLGSLNNISYEDFIKKVTPSEMKMLGTDLNKKAILGSTDFIEKVKSEIESKEIQAQEQTSIKPNNKFIASGALLIVLLIIASVFSYVNMMRAKKTLENNLENNEELVNKQLSEEKLKVYQELDSRQRADEVAFRAMQKRIEIEKQKTQELEEKLKSSEKIKAKK